MLKWLALGGLWVGLLSTGANAQRVTPIASLDASKFLGTWFEIARLPNRVEKKCMGSAFMMYAPDYKVGRFQIVDSCKRPDGTADVRNLSGRRADKSGDGKLKVITIWPFSTKYWVIGTGNSGCSRRRPHSRQISCRRRRRWPRRRGSMRATW
jgi:apolipoprotein D and lipocalin family protein